MSDDVAFTPFRVSTTTVTGSFDSFVNIVDIAKYLSIDDVIIGVKLVYAGGYSSIIRGVARLSKKMKDFYNQVTITIRMPIDRDDRTQASMLIENFQLVKMIAIEKNSPPELRLLTSHDHLLYSSNGTCIGWKMDDRIFVSNKWVNNSKNVYSLDGVKIGEKRLLFDTEAPRNFEVKYGCIYSLNKIIGTEVNIFYLRIDLENIFTNADV
ncbi:hypothetical protein BDK51DRAFT_32215 [Blyttiomyces helicus]|uniref:Uncharacterized protein n=1 Tax=Blyttiomyces helicus TaxID=388810 RepID=A0A4P9VZ34_9FUNG|nr:hypothetical protein BDK51DRAFT_32215 [Blyttiomyces helicus]|eukprot:RKO85024.1 hypothetical protein BDK51DRAFT_32215 [Blyttiomyces helicus]